MAPGMLILIIPACLMNACLMNDRSRQLTCVLCRLQTTDEGYARNQFWLQHRTGKKLSPEAAQLVAERVGGE